MRAQHQLFDLGTALISHSVSQEREEEVVPPEPGEDASWAERLAQRAGWAATHRTGEAELRHDLFGILEPYAIDELEISRADVRQEGTATAGRFDSLFGRCVIEYKHPGLLSSPAERERAANQAIGYLEDLRIGAEVVIVTDGSTWGILRDETSAPEVGEQGWLDLGFPVVSSAADRFAWRPTSPQTCERVLALMATVRAAPVSAISVIDRLGPGRDEVIAVLRRLADALASRAPQSRADVLFLQWLQLAGVAYGIDDAETAWPKPPEKTLGSRLAPALGSRRYAEAVFCLHTYVAFAAKLIAAEVLALASGYHESRPTQWGSLSDVEFATRLRALESGELTAQMRAPDLLAGDLFGWYTPLLADDSKFVADVRAVITGFAELAWARLANARGVAGDLLRDFYAATIPSAMRKALGEFFTPQWAAERVLTRAYELAELDGPARVMDPSCGSGTFLVAATRQALARALAAGADEAEAAVKAVESVIGFDINPVAVLMARVNLLLALGDRVDLLPSISFHVYQTDSILLPDVVRGQQSFDQQDELRLPLLIGPVDIPASLATLEGLRALRANVEHGVENRRPVDRFATRLRGDLRRLGLEGDGLAVALQGATSVYVQILKLAEDEKNGIWARVIEQAFAPTIVERVDLVVGNPPWINWKHLPEAWQQRSRATWEAWGLWQQKRKGGGIPLADISTLMLARSVATYCRPGGVVALLMPQSVLLADPGGRHIRRCRLANASTASDEVVHFSPVAVDDFTALHPFSPDAANMPIGLYVKAGEEGQFPVPQTRWTRAAARNRLPSDQSWSATMKLLAGTTDEIAPIEARDPSSPWARVAEADDLRLLPPDRRNSYRWGQGFHTRGADGLLFVEVTTPRPVGPSRLVRIRSIPSAGPNTKGEPVREAEVEAAFLWPMLRGQNVNPFGVTPSGQYVIVAHNPEKLTEVLTVDELAEAAPRLYDYLEPWIERFANRSPYGELRPTAVRPWGIQGPWLYLRRTAPLVVCRYIHPRKMPPAAPVAAMLDARLDLITTVYPNNKANFVAVRDEDEAWYVASFVNAPVAQRAIARFVSTTTIGPAALQRLPVPLWNPADETQRRLAGVGRAVHAGDRASDELDDLVRSLSGDLLAE